MNEIDGRVKTIYRAILIDNDGYVEGIYSSSLESLKGGETNEEYWVRLENYEKERYARRRRARWRVNSRC